MRINGSVALVTGANRGIGVLSWVAMPDLASCSASESAAWGWTNAARLELKRQGTEVVGVHPGPVDTDMTAGFDIEKIAPQLVAIAALDALEQGPPEALVDDFSRTIKAGLADDQRLVYPGIEEQFNATVPVS